MRCRTAFITCLCVLLWPGLAHAIFFPGPIYIPYDRLIANTEAYIAAHPNEPQGYYTLARTHYFAFVDKTMYVPTSNENYSPPQIAPHWQIPYGDLLYYWRGAHAQELILDAWGYETVSDVPAERRAEFWQAVRDKQQELADQQWEPEYLDQSELLIHAGAAVDNFERSLDLDPENGLFYLGLASLYEQYSSYATDANVTEHPKQLANVTIPNTRLTYYLAYRFSIEEDSNWDCQPLWGLRELVSYEAGKAYLRMAEMEPSIADSNSVARVKDDIAKLDTLPVCMITPIIFSMQKHDNVLDLLEPQNHVSFDLDGDGRIEKWPWLKESTGLLVWDPLGKGKISSGRQLFGTATWWLLFPDGYFALDVLDNNRDGMLSGKELKGIGVWFDKNTNGISEEGEVQSAKNFGIEGIGTRSTGSDNGMLSNKKGITLKGGSAIPTYDWVVSPISSKSREIQTIKKTTIVGCPFGAGAKMCE